MHGRVQVRESLPVIHWNTKHKHERGLAISANSDEHQNHIRDFDSPDTFIYEHPHGDKTRSCIEVTAK
jgi:hypothetical protein